jgi:8-oxo-dGTP diphosphatase
MSSQSITSNQTTLQPRYGAKALFSTEDRVLVVKERHTNGGSFWTLPGGGHDAGESLTETVHRELSEELRCRATVREPIASFWYAHSHSGQRLSRYTVFDCCLHSSVLPNVVEGVYDSRWVRPDQIPETTLPQVRHLIQFWEKA